MEKLLNELLKDEAMKIANVVLDMGLTVIANDYKSSKKSNFFSFSDGVSIGYIQVGEWMQVSTSISYIPSTDMGSGYQIIEPRNIDFDNVGVIKQMITTTFRDGYKYGAKYYKDLDAFLKDKARFSSIYTQHTFNNKKMEN